MTKTWKTWTALETKRLIELRNQGLLIREIATLLGRSFSSVRHRCRQLDLPKTRIIERYIPLFQIPHRIEEVAQKMGVSHQSCVTIKSIIKKMGFEVAEAIIDKEQRYARFRKEN